MAEECRVDWMRWEGSGVSGERLRYSQYFREILQKKDLVNMVTEEIDQESIREIF